jgi:hypothetical protein
MDRMMSQRLNARARYHRLSPEITLKIQHRHKNRHTRYRRAEPKHALRIAVLAPDGLEPYISRMSPLRARVEKGRLVLNEPTTLPDGMVIDLVADDEGDNLTDEERRALHATLAESWKSAEAGRVRSGSELIDELRNRR